MSRFKTAETVRAALLSAALIALTMPAAAAEVLEDVHYVVIPAQPLTVPGKIEVIEFFYYGCESCNRLEVPLRAWLKTLAPDVNFRRIPALRRTAWVPLARLYFALEQLGEIGRLHESVYGAVHEQRLNLANSSERHRWAQQSGLDRGALDQLMDSDGVDRQVQSARDATVAYGIRVTPSFVINGQYLTSGGMVGSLDALLAVVDGLIDKARATGSR